MTQNNPKKAFLPLSFFRWVTLSCI